MSPGATCRHGCAGGTTFRGKRGMYIDGIRSALEKCVEEIPEKGPRLNSAWWTQLERCIRL